MFIENADHGFGGAVDPPSGYTDHRDRELLRDALQLACVKSSTTAFWDAHLKDESQAKDFLATGRLDQLTGGKCQVTAK